MKVRKQVYDESLGVYVEKFSVPIRPNPNIVGETIGKPEGVETPTRLLVNIIAIGCAVTFVTYLAYLLHINEEQVNEFLTSLPDYVWFIIAALFVFVALALFQVASWSSDRRTRDFHKELNKKHNEKKVKDE